MWKYCNITLWSLCPISFLPVDKFKETRVIPKVLDVTDIWRKSAAIFFALKLVSAIFYQFLCFHQMIAFQKLKNIFYFIWKALFVLEIFKLLYFLLLFSTYSRFKKTNRIIQKKSASGSQMLPYLVIFFRNLILIWKLPKMVFK